MTSTQLATASGTVTVGTGSTANNQNLGTSVDSQGVPTVINSGGAADVGADQGQGLGGSQNLAINECLCITKDTLNWSSITPTWTPGATTGTVTQGGATFSFTNTFTGGTFVPGSPGVGALYQGDQPAADHTLVLAGNGSNLLTNDIVTTINIGSPGTGATGVFFKLFDLDGSTGAVTYKERVVIKGYLNGVEVKPLLQGTSAHIIDTTTGTVKGVPDTPTTGSGSELGVVQVAFATAVDQVVLTFDVTENTSGTPGQPGYGIHDISFCPIPVCYNAPTDLSSSVPVKHGITLLQRAGKHTGTTTTNDWPMVRNSAYTALESKTKGFVITRNSNPEGTIANPVVGMMVFDTDEDSGKGCLKIYTGPGVSEGWKCFNTQTCP